MRVAIIALFTAPLITACGDKVINVIGPAVEDCDDGFGRAADGNCYPIDATVTDSGSPSDSAEPGDTGLSAYMDEDADGHTPSEGDCDDTNGSVYPGAPEVCDGVDNDCDALIDEEPTDGITGYRDLDRDGYGDDRVSVRSCAMPADYVTVGGDCNDTSPSTHPGAAERCDGEDNDCNGTLDDGVMHTWYADADSDGFGADGTAVEACDPGPGYVGSNTDCDDANPSAHPGAVEICDGADNDCDGVLDNGLAEVTFYRDVDDDGYGDPDATLVACTAPDGYAATGNDCNDDAADVRPDATEICTDDVDNNCDGSTDCEDGATCKTAEPACWLCGDGIVDPGEECDEGDTVDGDGCSSTCAIEGPPIDLAGLHGSWTYDDREVYVWQSDDRPITDYDAFCEERGLNWFTPDSAEDAQHTITTLDGWDSSSHPTWIITKNASVKGSTALWGGFEVTVDEPYCVDDSSSGFSAIRRMGCSMCDPDNPDSHEYSGTTSCWDSNDYDWLVCEE